MNLSFISCKATSSCSPSSFLPLNFLSVNGLMYLFIALLRTVINSIKPLLMCLFPSSSLITELDAKKALDQALGYKDTLLRFLLFLTSQTDLDNADSTTLWYSASDIVPCAGTLSCVTFIVLNSALKLLMVTSS